MYSVRDKILPDYSNLDSLLFQLAEMGYTGVEAANYNEGKFYGRTPQEFREAVEKAGMTVLSSHTGRGLSAQELASATSRRRSSGGTAVSPTTRPRG